MRTSTNNTFIPWSRAYTLRALVFLGCCMPPVSCWRRRPKTWTFSRVKRMHIDPVSLALSSGQNIYIYLTFVHSTELDSNAIYVCKEIKSNRINYNSRTHLCGTNTHTHASLSFFVRNYMVCSPFAGCVCSHIVLGVRRLNGGAVQRIELLKVGAKSPPYSISTGLRMDEK